MQLANRLRTMGAAAATLVLCGLNTVQAEERPAADLAPPIEAPKSRIAGAKVFIEFEGGIASSAMASVIHRFGVKSRILPVRVYRPDDTVGLCPILESELKLPGRNCTTDLIGSIVWLNRLNKLVLDPNAVQPTRGVYLPAVEASITEITRIFDLSNTEEKNRLDQILNNPGWGDFVGRTAEDILGSNEKNDPTIPHLNELSIKRIAWEFQISGAERVAEATLIGKSLATTNLMISVQNIEGFVKSKYAASATSVFQNWCAIPPVSNNTDGSFAGMVGGLYDTSLAVSKSCPPPPPPRPRPKVVMMDQPITPHPDLGHAFLKDDAAIEAELKQLGPACQPGNFVRDVDHSSLLATIIGASANNYGFVGMAPDAVIEAYPWNQKPELNNDLRRFVERVWPKTEVFLLASKFAPYPPQSAASAVEKRLADKTWKKDDNDKWIFQLKDDNVRLEEDIARTVLQTRMLLVAAAGQTPEGNAPFEIQADTPMSPQNLGDFDNVLVVAACEDCDKPTARLWAESNRGANDADRSFVGVLAPGGQNVPSYVSNGKIAMTQGGTSSAAAFVAGLAASMSQCYPDNYRLRPGDLKERIILASRPVLDGSSHVAGGVIDPSISMLDPAKTWLKLQTQPVRPVTMKRWCKDHLNLKPTAAGLPDPWFLKKARRLTMVDQVGLIYQSSEILPGERYPARTIRRKPPGIAAENGVVAAVQYEGQDSECAVDVGSLKDLFLSQNMMESGECSALPLCQ
ncbi:S8 family serine peptidase [Mesorhizobium prunaredense]|nr:S8 family serine peptidase [Mesorhizobium prunaredense]